VNIAATIAAEIGAQETQVSTALKLLAEGNTVPFIARYRKEVTGGLDDAQLRTIEERTTYLRELEERKETVLAAIDEQGKLSDDRPARFLPAITRRGLGVLNRP